MTVDWASVAIQIASGALGGALVMVANSIAHRRGRRREEEKQQERNAALFTAVFTVRNFIVSTLNEWETHKNVAYINISFRTALENIQSIIEKSPPDTQYVMSALYEMSLALGDIVAATDVEGFSLTHF